MRVNVWESNYRSLSATDANATGGRGRMGIRDQVSIGEVRGNGERHAHRKTLLGRTKDPSMEDPRTSRGPFRERILYAALDRERKKGKRAISIAITIDPVPFDRSGLSLSSPRTKHDSSFRKMTCSPFVSFSLYIYTYIYLSFRAENNSCLMMNKTRSGTGKYRDPSSKWRVPSVANNFAVFLLCW